jgi:hypothetical protein
LNTVAEKVRLYASTLEDKDKHMVEALHEIAADIEAQDTNPLELAATQALVTELTRRSDACVVLQYRHKPTDGEAPTRLMWGPKSLPLPFAARMCSFAHNQFVAQGSTWTTEI